jgi:Zn-dependent peptidase ImmA (M78 family)/DNA-binding XRE family transcriptional regulator
MFPKPRKSSLGSSDEVPKPESLFNPTRLMIARKRKGLTKIEFANRMGIALRSYKAYELGEYPPSPETTKKIASVSGFPAGFFFGDDLDEPSADTASFRSMSRMKASQRAMALSQGALALHLNRWLEERFELPSVDIPDFSGQCAPGAAAEALRHHWGIGELPIRNMIHLLESRGVRIYSLAIDAREVDAFSMWKEETPFVFLNSKKSSERSRYDAAHELGHLVLHRHGGPRGREAEQEADAFASSFLMPRASVLAHATSFPTLATLVSLKRIWTVSVAALCYRLRALDMITEWQYRMLYIQISKNRFRTREPNEAARETSQVLPKIFAALHKEGITRSKVAVELAIPRDELESMMFGLTMASVEGGGKGTSARSHLTLVN